MKKLIISKRNWLSAFASKAKTTIALVLAATFASLATSTSAGPPPQTVARQWNEAMLNAIRHDYARPTVHARNLYHVSVAMWDAWAVYSADADQIIFHEKSDQIDNSSARRESISFAAYRVLNARFAKSPGADITIPVFDNLMDTLGYDKSFTGTVGSSPAAIGNRCAIAILSFGFNDGANEQGGYVNQYYYPVNEPLLPDFPGNPDLTEPNRWQPLALEWFKDQGGNIDPGGYPEFLSPEWGIVTSFSLKTEDLTIYQRDGFDYWVFHDPGPPPHLGTKTEYYYKWGNEQVSIWSSHLDATDGVMWDISPATIGNSILPDPDDFEAFYDLFNGGDWGTGYDVNPYTGKPYAPQIVPRGDYARILAEFWADGPDSETPPGHWFVLLNYVNDHPLLEKRFGGEGPIIADLQWDVQAYVLMAGTMHDVAIAAWGIKGWYDYIRPISAIRYMSDLGQCTDPKAPRFDPQGINLRPGFIELITPETAKTYHSHIAGKNNENIDKIAILAWRGHDYINDPDIDVAGVDWILAENWWPYQRPTFVTPPFAGYVSGHSTYSRAAAIIMSTLTGDEYFPGGIGEFFCPQNEFLVFEDGPSMDVTLQWAKYNDASDQCSLSRIWGGIHPGADDLPGRIIGQEIGPDAFCHGAKIFNGQISCPADIDGDGGTGVSDLLALFAVWDSQDCYADINGDLIVNTSDIIELFANWGPCP
ncbi:MAG: vanadium-dependent haloperoxidase [Planctomycetes bacterium]|nr:vanadium-dependent haloperoxidase [Planctomycetota bacterium]